MRPDLSELNYYASLISHQPDVVRTRETLPKIAATLSATERLAKLDYHGIALLALENRALDAELVDLLAQRKPMMIANEVLKRNALIELFDAFHAAGLTRTVLFKGSALAYSHYSHPWLRARTDSDCLIDRSQLDRYQAVLARLGYRKLFAIEGRQVSYQSTFSKALAGNSVINIDVHWRINNRQILANSFSLEELHSEGVTVPALGPSITIPNKVDSLLIAGLHRLGHHHNEERLTWLNDIHYLAGSLQADDWQILIDKAVTKKLSAITLDALELCSELFSTEVAGEAISQLQLQAREYEPSQIFLNRELPEWQYFWHELRALPGVIDRCGLIFENVFPKPDYVRRQMQTNNAAMGYLKRFWRGLKRVTKAGR